MKKKSFYYYKTGLLLVENYENLIGCLYNDDKVDPLYVMLPETSSHVKDYGHTKWMYFLIHGDDLLEKSNAI